MFGSQAEFSRSLKVALLVFVVCGCSKPEPSATINKDARPQDQERERERKAGKKDLVAKQVTSSAPNEFVGSLQCKVCHPKNYEGFSKTDHHSSLRVPDVTEEKELVRLVHESSRQRYSVKVDQGVLQHNSWQSVQDQEMQIASVDIKYVMGSGAFAKSYIHEADGFLFQSPLSYYVGAAQYDMSPGYDTPDHVGFTRQLSDECFVCHAGSVSSEGGRLTLGELSIGCERCHGPGHRHSVSMKDAQDDSSKLDLNIVHPGKLDRLRLEAICAQCHLQGDITMYADGASGWSFKPGQLLEESKLEYARAKETDDEVGFVSHFSQMRSSECYKNSDTLTCITCHDPHHLVDETSAIEWHRSSCLSCHENEHCKLEISERLTRNENSCFECHMPRGESEVPHVAVTNHQIAVPEIDSDGSGAPVGHPEDIPEMGLPRLVALADGSLPGSWQRERNEQTALARYVIEKQKFKGASRDDIKTLVASLRASLGSHENVPPEEALNVVNVSQTQLMLARLISPIAAWRFPELGAESTASVTPITKREYSEYMTLITNVLEREEVGSPEYRLSLSLVASEMSTLKNYNAARQYYEKLVTLRQDSSDWYNLGLVYGRLRQFQQAEAAFKKAIQIEGNYSKPYRSLGRLYKSIDANRSEQMSGIADLLDKVRASSNSP